MDNLDKFDSKADEGILGYSLHRHEYSAYNRRTILVEESMHIAFDETDQNMQENPKIGANDEVPNIQQVDNSLSNKPEEPSKLPEIQSMNREINQLNPELVEILSILDCQQNGEFLKICHWTM